MNILRYFCYYLPDENWAMYVVVVKLLLFLLRSTREKETKNYV